MQKDAYFGAFILKCKKQYQTNGNYLRINAKDTNNLSPGYKNKNGAKYKGTAVKRYAFIFCIEVVKGHITRVTGKGHHARLKT